MTKRILSKHTIEFLTVTTEFVRFCENPDTDSREEFITTSTKLLSLLYLKALFLEKQEIETNNDEAYNLEFVTVARYEMVKASAERLLGDSDVYVPLRDGTMLNTEDYLNISLSELWADVYQDLANFTEAFRIGESELMQEATNRCCDNFASYWGVRLIALLDHFHRLSYLESKS